MAGLRSHHPGSARQPSEAGTLLDFRPQLGLESWGLYGEAELARKLMYEIRLLERLVNIPFLHVWPQRS
jgi:hypothetical protein